MMAKNVADFAKARAAKLDPTAEDLLDDFAVKMSEKGYKHVGMVLIDAEGDPGIYYTNLVDSFHTRELVMLAGTLDILKARILEGVE